MYMHIRLFVIVISVYLIDYVLNYVSECSTNYRINHIV